jgi:hypothetical protein
MGWKDTVWERRQIERYKNAQDVDKILGYAEQAYDIGAGIAQGLKIKNPFNMSGAYQTFKKSLFY